MIYAIADVAPVTIVGLYCGLSFLLAVGVIVILLWDEL